LIAEVILYSEGFESSKNLALKMTQMYKLCSEQLSQQDHYDFGMRALKSVLVMAGSLKRQNPDKPEDVVLIRALRDSNLPKFLKQDAVLFTAILQDLFPGVTLPEHDYGRFLAEIQSVLQSMGLQVVPAQVTKVIQFFETLLVRHGVMLVGPTGGGKTTVYRVLIKVLTNLHDAGLSSEVPEYQPVKTYVLNPKAITMGELYGEVNKLTLEWHDGLLASIVRRTCVLILNVLCSLASTQDLTEDHQWVICDGPVDALWIENMNTVLDDNKMLCLANSERIKLTNYVHMLFEVQDLAVASPATVSRCGMVYVDPEELGWMPYVQTWMSTIEGKLTPAVRDYLLNLFNHYVDPCLNFVMHECTPIIPQDLAQTLAGTPIEVEQPRFEELDNLVAEIRLKQLLWDSLEEWDALNQEWMTADFLKIDPEELSNITNKYTKSVTQLEKGLPPNNVVPLLKEKVDGMREKVRNMPAIMDLRNPTLKPRHWQQLEALIGFNLAEMEEPLSLGLLTSLNAFDHSAAIQEVSSQASSEASLELLLKKVEDAWKSTEFTVIPYKDSKDVFIVGGTDEIQQLWDDSNINIATIASSRHVGPIKSRVEEWQILLDLFGKTLDEWLQCQRSWLYLESIFSAPDIQRQLPSEAKSFMAVDKSYKDVMRKVQKVPLAMHEPVYTNDILAMLSPEGERVALGKRPSAIDHEENYDLVEQAQIQHSRGESTLPDDASQSPTPLVYFKLYALFSLTFKGLKARGNVEDWLGKVEEAMFTNLRKLMKVAIHSFESSERDEWLRSHANQIILTVEQLMWSRDITLILEDPFPEDRLEGLEEYEKKCFQELNKLATMVRGELPKLLRALLCALITIDVHARDMVTELVASKVDSLTNFDWQRQLRYYWDEDVDTCVVRMANACYTYGYEYLGASPRLVITPLTDRCPVDASPQISLFAVTLFLQLYNDVIFGQLLFLLNFLIFRFLSSSRNSVMTETNTCYLCLMGALQLDLGGAPAGPAGTGKTETTKDLSKSVAKQCVVFNCSDGLDYKMMGRFFSGLAQSGAWCCFDEFNRIDIEVLSVIAQQLITIRNAKAAKVSSVTSIPVANLFSVEIFNIQHEHSNFCGVLCAL
uniref:Dynein axonemal heavy chain 3 n=1 Tax=Echinostoma caproni TaxID=27848 RepID=A0A183ADC6_9TREM